MDQNQKSLTIVPALWSKAAASALSEAVPFASSDDLKAQVKAGASLFAVFCDAQPVGFYLLRVDQTESGAEGVLVAASGDLAGVDLTATLVPVIEKQFTGCRSMRIHTARPGLARKLARMGYRAGEIILRKTL